MKKDPRFRIPLRYLVPFTLLLAIVLVLLLAPRRSRPREVEIDRTAAELRKIDNLLQQTNWSIELNE